MKQLVAIAIFMSILTSPPALSGVVMELVTRDSSGQETERSKIYSQAEMIRMDEVDGTKPEVSIIFLGDELVYVDHREESYFIMDDAMLDKVSARMNDAMKEMEAQLAAMPPEQRAMMEQMMKGRMKGMTRQKGEPEQVHRVESLGSGKWESYKCRQYAVFKGSEKTQDVCAAALDDIDGADDVMQAFRKMAAYLTKMTESMPMRSAERPNPGELMDQIDGFPVHTTDYTNGVATRETSLDSVAEQDIGPETFTAPVNYRQQDPF